MKLPLALLAGGAAPAAALYGAPRPVQIIPSVLPADFAALGLDCTALEKAGCDRIQFDVMDGNFVPNLTFGPDLCGNQTVRRKHLGRAVRNRHHHAIEQASRRWRGGCRDV